MFKRADLSVEHVALCSITSSRKFQKIVITVYNLFIPLKGDISVIKNKKVFLRVVKRELLKSLLLNIFTFVCICYKKYMICTI